MNNQKGFTLIELVVVIVILGILAAVAVPRFVNMQGDARAAAVNGAAGAIKGAGAIAHAQALVKNVTAGTIVMEGQNVTIVNGYPATATGGIDNAVDVDGFTFSAGVFSLDGSPTPATCSVTYAQPTGANLAPTYTIQTAGCF